MSRQAHPWLPVSPCGDGCLPPAGAVPAAGPARQLLRLLATAAMLLVGMLLAVVLPPLRPSDRERALRAWSRALLGA
ncbi:MAG: 1-acyl-sn-glycerol-3-phosphate acyltransferase, partial [Pseudonocardiaceae bacterium]